MIVLSIIVVILIIVILGLIYIDHRNAKLFTNGTWIDSDGNLLVMRIDGMKIFVSFGVNTDDDKYELTEKKYSYLCMRIPFSRSYKIKLSGNIKININTISGIATVYRKNKKIGMFAKNNLILISD